MDVPLAGGWSTNLADDETSTESGARRPSRRRQASGGRNTGWYIPFWRKPRRGQPDQALGERGERRRRPRTRSEQDLDRVRNEWIARYNSRLSALRLLGLSVGTPNDEIAERYESLHTRLALLEDTADQLEALDDAYALLRSEQ